MNDSLDPSALRQTSRQTSAGIKAMAVVAYLLVLDSAFSSHEVTRAVSSNSWVREILGAVLASVPLLAAAYRLPRSHPKWACRLFAGIGLVDLGIAIAFIALNTSEPWQGLPGDSSGLKALKAAVQLFLSALLFWVVYGRAAVRKGLPPDVVAERTGDERGAGNGRRTHRS
jgi:hypothetical protein